MAKLVTYYAAVFGILLVVLTTEAKAISCKQFQQYVESYGIELVKQEAMKRGISEATINNLIRKCIRR